MIPHKKGAIQATSFKALIGKVLNASFLLALPERLETSFPLWVS